MWDKHQCSALENHLTTYILLRNTAHQCAHNFLEKKNKNRNILAVFLKIIKTKKNLKINKKIMPGGSQNSH